MASKVFPVLLSGGAGSRLWPLSREGFPKQLLPLAGERTPLQAAAARVLDPARFEPPMVVANVDHRFIVAEQLRELRTRDATIILEPVARNTAAAIAAAALVALAKNRDAVLLVMPADHHLPHAEGFRAAVAAGLPAAEQGALVLFGVPADRAATGYGYIRAGAPRIGGARAVERFIEKPDLATAERLLASGDHAWNSGIFLLPARRLLDELRAYEPALLRAVERAVEVARPDADFLRLDPDAFAESPSISIDHAVMERTAHAVVVPAAFVWADLGAWSSLWEIETRDAAGNVLKGDVVALDTRGSYLRSEGPLVATVGVEDLIVVAMKDAVLVAAKSADQQVRALVDILKAQGHPTAG
jgi:mannose-1-phosphate guanylyltransferase/mannose-1-phosphate guanylyltransferase/mannose-6-phosphate isomerase